MAALPSYRPQVHAVAVIGKQATLQNNPLYVTTFDNHAELKFLYVVHTSLDIIEEKVATGTKNSEMYLGLLHSVENLRVEGMYGALRVVSGRQRVAHRAGFAAHDICSYGYMTNTKVKFIVVLSALENQIKENDVRLLMQRLHQEYVFLTYNPFYDFDALRITSPKFAASVRAVVQSVNMG